MEFQLGSVFISLVLVCVGKVAWMVLNCVWLKPKRLERCLRNQGFKGNPYKLLFGDSKEIISLLTEATSLPMDPLDNILPRVLPLHHYCVNRHGKNYFQWFGTTPRITITDPKLIKEMASNHEVFRKPATNPFFKLLLAGLLTYEGEKWAKHRNRMNPAFQLEMLKQLLPAMYLSCTQMTRRWEALVTPKGGSHEEVDVWPDICSLTGDVISRTAFGSNYEEGKGIFELHITQTETVLQCVQSPYIPGWRFLPTRTNKKMKANYQEVKTILTKIINKRKEASEGEDFGNDLMGILLKANHQSDGKTQTGELSTEDLTEELKQLYIAGQETTAALLVWTMLLLSKHQKWQDLARQEAVDVFGDNEPSFEGLNRLRTMNMILNEVLRLYSPTGFLLKTVNKETKLGHLRLPQGTEILVPTIAIHREPEFWGEDALEFKPERFSQGILKVTKGQNIFFPFGGGPRICIGQNYAMLEVKIALATILRQFKFQLSPNYVHAPCLVLTLQPQHGVPLILHKI